MRTWIGWLIVLACAWGTHAQIPVWSSDLRLWQQAAVVSPTNPRPAVNIAAQHALAMRVEEAHFWIARARTLLAAPNRRDVRAKANAILDQQESWISAFSR